MEEQLQKCLGAASSARPAARRLAEPTACQARRVRPGDLRPDGKTLLSGGTSRIIAWDLDPSDMVRQACQTLASDPGLSQAETLVPNASYNRLCPSR